MCPCPPLPRAGIALGAVPLPPELDADASAWPLPLLAASASACCLPGCSRALSMLAHNLDLHSAGCLAS